MMELIVNLKRIRSIEKIAAKPFNILARQAMEHAGQVWIDEFLPLHFTQGAVQRYRYGARTSRTLAIKRKAREIMVRFGPKKGQKVPATKPPLPLVWTRELYDAAVGGKRTLTPRATATSNRVKVRVPIRLPHPMRRENASELTALNPMEVRILSDLVIARLMNLIRQQPSIVENTKITAGTGAA